jgi:CDP-glucose 4,6-dehydratase
MLSPGTGGNRAVGKPFAGAYAGKRVLLTGHTGFKGSWMALWLNALGARVAGYALAPPTTPSLFETAGVEGTLRHIEADVRDPTRLREVVEEVRPDIIFHLAAQSLVRASYELPLETLATNVMGTANLLEAVRAIAGPDKPCAVVIVTSDKCYENRERIYGYTEWDRIGGHDPYSMSKGAAELVVSSWRRSFFPADRIGMHGVRLASARAGNAIGGGDWGKDRIMTDCIASLRAEEPIGVRNPGSRRPWQHVLEPLSGYLSLGARLLDPAPATAVRYAEAWNFGPAVSNTWPVSRLVEEVVRCWGTGRWEDRSSEAAPHEASLLFLNCDKAFHLLGWKPVWDVSRAAGETVSWFKELESGSDMKQVSLAQISRYLQDAADGKTGRQGPLPQGISS